MRWLMIGLFISLGWLLFAVVGLVLHVWLHRRRLRRETLLGGARGSLDAAQETDLDIEP